MNRYYFPSLVLCAIAASIGYAAPNREPHGWTTPDAPLPVEWSKLPKNGGAKFGDWQIWRFGSGEEAALLIHSKTNLVVYVPWQSNGWLNYRTGDGQSYVLYSRGTPSPQTRDYDLQKYAKPPTAEVAAGTYTFGNWTATVTTEAIELHCRAMGCKMTVQRHSHVFTHNNRNIGGN